jgi:adenosylcobinamide-GDP ribazoletransferase
VKPFLLALQFLTIITLRPDLRAGPEDMSKSRAWYGAAGIIMGLCLALASWLLAQVLPALALAGVLVLLWGALSRFLHLDGLADTADALVHTTSRERALEIMKDTRLGAFGLCAVVGILLVKFGALASLPPLDQWRALLLAPGLARALACALSVLLPAATPGRGLGAAVSGAQGIWCLAAAAVPALAVAGLAAGVAGMVAACAVLAVGAALGMWYMRRLGGVTGDNLGAAIEVSEAAALVTCASLF